MFDNTKSEGTAKILYLYGTHFDLVFKLVMLIVLLVSKAIVLQTCPISLLQKQDIPLIDKGSTIPFERNCSTLNKHPTSHKSLF